MLYMTMIFCGWPKKISWENFAGFEFEDQGMCIKRRGNDEIYVDFDWFKETGFVGELGYESLRDSDSYCFTISNEWLKKHRDLFLSDDLNNYPGQQYT